MYWRRCTRAKHYLLVAVTAMLLLPEVAAAGKFLDYIRNYDLNDFALGVAISGQQNPYIGAKNSTIAYPYLTSFNDPAFTDDWLLIRGGNIGVRWVTNNDWELGVVTRIQTLGLGNSDADELIGIADKKWAIELGPTIGWRGWPVHFNFTAYTEVSGHHDGTTSELSISVPFKLPRGYIIPSFELYYRDSAYLDYYYGVTDDEVLPSRPAYSPSDEISPALMVRFGHELSPKWLLSGGLGVEYSGSEITDSPIVDRDYVWSARVGIAYNANIFQPRSREHSGADDARFEFRIGAFYDFVSSKVVRHTSDGVPGFEIDIEDLLGASDEELVPQFDAIYRFGNYHSLEAGYFKLARQGSIVLEDDLEFGDEVFPAGTEIQTEFDASVFQVSYVYSLMKDAQKELGLMAGLHSTNFTTVLTVTSTGQTERSSVGSPLPVVGLLGSVTLGAKARATAKLQLFRMDFDGYEGALTYITIDLQRQFSKNVSGGIGYNYYRMNISSSNSEVNGYLQLLHQGPAAFITVSL
jgi:outer membrane protein